MCCRSTMSASDKPDAGLGGLGKFVEQKRAYIGGCVDANLVPHRLGKGAFDMPK